MKIIVLLPEYDDINEIDLSFMTEYEIKYTYVNNTNYEEIIQKIMSDDIVLNLCDGSKEEGTLGIEIIETLEKYNKKFIGSSSKNYSWTKSDIRKFNNETSFVRTPNYQLLRKNEEIKTNLKYPLFIKPNTSGGGSIGITQDSKVNTNDELNKTINNIFIDFDEVIIEEYIDGREFTILVVENGNLPIVLEPLECVFNNNYKYKDYDLKWINYNNISYKQVEDSLQQKLITFAQDCFIKLKLDGYVRFDVRMTNDIYLIDVNPYCGMFYPKALYGCADHILEQSKIMNHKTFLEHLITMKN